MIRFTAGYIPKREANLIGLGVTDDNLRILLVDNKPIHVSGESLGFNDFDIVIYAAADRQGIEQRGLDHFKPFLPEEKPGEVIKIPCMYMGETFYLFPFMGKNERMLYVIGLDEKSYHALRARRFPTFRVRHVGSDATNIEVLMFWGVSEDRMEEEFYKAGLIDRGTTVRRQI
jgi:hypothetical protein